MKRVFGPRLAVVGIAAVVISTVAVFSGAGLASPKAPARATAVPDNRVAPAIGGVFREGQLVATTNGSWKGKPTSFSYQWQRCDAAGQNCVKIVGATAQRYRLTAADVAHTLLVLVSATNASGTSAPANSQPSPVVSGSAAPTNTARPSITGTPAVGETLTAVAGSWTGGPDRFAYRWQRCDEAGANCILIAGAAGSTYGVRSADLGRTLRVEVTARNGIGAATATSDRTAVVKESAGGTGGTGGTTTGGVSISRISLPNRLVISGVQFTPNPVRSRTDPITARFRVTDLRGRPVVGALVYVIGLPYGRLANAPEQPTGPGGYATIPLRATPLLPLVNGGAIVMFVRARKAGENLLAGVSSRRLVQLRVAAP